MWKWLEKVTKCKRNKNVALRKDFFKAFIENGMEIVTKGKENKTKH